MTVKELIDKLSQLDPNLQIFINGYERGYKDVKDISDIEEIALNIHEFEWMGPHELVKNKYYVKDKSEYEIVKGIIIWSELTKFEFISTLCKNVRIKNITKDQAENNLRLFESDFEKYCFDSYST